MLSRPVPLSLGVVLLIMCSVGIFWDASVAAQKAAKPAPQPPAKTAPAQDDAPVALTPRSKPAPEPETKSIPKGEFGNMAGPVINNKGEVGFIGRYVPDPANGPGTSFFILKNDGKIGIALRGNEKIAGIDAPLVSLGSFHLNDTGEVTFSAIVDKPAPCPNSSGEERCAAANQKMAGLFLTAGSIVKPVAVIGQEIPNSPSTYIGFGASSINSKSSVSFIGTYTDPDGRGLFIVEDGKTKLVARSGQRSPAGKDNTYSEHFYPSPINDRGEVAFFCRVDTGGAIFIYRPSGIEAIAVQDKESPIPGSNYIGFGNRTPAINSKGDVAFAGFVDGEKAGRLLFLYTGGKTSVVLRSGDTIPDSLATFTDFTMPSINARSEIAFVANYAGRARGVFVKTAQGVEAIALYDKFAPGMERVEGNMFNNFLNPVINDNGDIAFMAQLKDAKVGMFIKKKGEPLKLIAKTGDKLPTK